MFLHEHAHHLLTRTETYFLQPSLANISPNAAVAASIKNAADKLALAPTAPISAGATMPPRPQPALMRPVAPADASGNSPAAEPTSVDQTGP